MGWVVAIAAALLGSGPALPAGCPDAERIAIGHAPACVGRTKTVTGRVDHVSRSRGGTTFVNFCADWRACPFTAVVLREHAALAQGLTRFARADVAVRGEIISYKGRPEILLTSLDQITLLSAAPAGEPERLVPPPRPRRSLGPLSPEPTAFVPPAAPAAPVAARRPDAAPPPARRAPSALRPAEGGELLPAGAAGEHVGETRRVRGRVLDVRFEGDELVVSFGRPGEELPFVAVVPESEAGRLAPLVRSLPGTFVAVSGAVSYYNGVPCIYVRDEAQLAAAEAPGAGSP